MSADEFEELFSVYTAQSQECSGCGCSGNDDYGKDYSDTCSTWS